MAKLVELSPVLDTAGLSRSELYRRVSRGTFPKPCKVGRRSLWVDAEVQAWVAEQIAERDTQARIAGARAANRAIQQGARA